MLIKNDNVNENENANDNNYSHSFNKASISFFSLGRWLITIAHKISGIRESYECIT